MEKIRQAPKIVQATPPVSKTPVASVVKKFPVEGLKKSLPMAAIVLLVVLAGVGTGWLLSGRVSGRSGGFSGQAAPGANQSAKEAGLADEKTFRDTAEGKLEEGGIAGEGTHHLVRDGGETQYVYLTSTVIDLQSFVGKKVQVWGETITGKKAGWLMDVGKIKVIE